MPTRRKPNSNPTRFKALTIAKEMKDSVPPPLIIPFTPATILKLDTKYPIYKAKIEAGEAALQVQLQIAGQIKTAKSLAEFLISDFYDALQRAIRRGAFDSSVRTSYGLAGNDATTPLVRTEADIVFWGGKAAAGEAARILAGGAPITFPPIAEVTAAVNAFKALNIQQANAKIAYDTAQEVIAADNVEIDILILKMWNEIETTFDEGNKPSMRRKAREWGVYYLPTPGEVLSPDEFSIAGNVRVEGTGSTPGIDDVQITVVETGEIVSSEPNGDFFVGVLIPGPYTLLLEKPNFVSKTINNVQVVAGVITQLDIQLTPTGGIAGQVLQGGSPVASLVEVLGTGLTAIPDALGNYFRNDIPAGQQTVRATITGSNPPLFIDHIVTVSAGGVLEVVFSFP